MHPETCVREYCANFSKDVPSYPKICSQWEAISPTLAYWTKPAKISAMVLKKNALCGSALLTGLQVLENTISTNRKLQSVLKLLVEL